MASVGRVVLSSSLPVVTRRRGSSAFIWRAFHSHKHSSGPYFTYSNTVNLNLEPEEPRKGYDNIGKVTAITLVQIGPSSSSVRTILPYAK